MVKKTATKKRYIPNSKEKYMCSKHKKFFTGELINWKKEIIKANNLGNLLNSSDDNGSSADIVDQASSYTDKSYPSLFDGSRVSSLISFNSLSAGTSVIPGKPRANLRI